MSTELLKEKQAAVLVIANPTWTKAKFQGNPLVKRGFALLGNGISELKFLFLFFGLEEKCFSRNSLISPFAPCRKEWWALAGGGSRGDAAWEGRLG